MAFLFVSEEVDTREGKAGEGREEACHWGRRGELRGGIGSGSSRWCIVRHRLSGKQHREERASKMLRLRSLEIDGPDIRYPRKKANPILGTPQTIQFRHVERYNVRDVDGERWRP